MRYFNLHGHSTFSFLDGYGTPAQIADRIAEVGQAGAAITDHGNVFAHIGWQRAMRDRGLKPIFGCEFYVVDNMYDRSRHIATLGEDMSPPHVTVIAQTQRGYQNLLRLSRLSYVEGFYYKPRVDWETLARYQEGLVIFSGCPGGYPSTLLLKSWLQECVKFLEDRKRQIQNFYIEVVPEPGLDNEMSERTAAPLFLIAKHLDIPVVVTSDAHFPRPEDHLPQDILLAVGTRDRVNSAHRKLKLPAYQYYCTADELMARLKAVTRGQISEFEMQAAIERSALIADECEVELPKAKPFTFKGLRPDKTADQQLREDAHVGLARRKKSGLIPDDQLEQYISRLSHECGVIQRKGFSDYMLAVSDLTNWAKNRGHVVVCRGSAGGSLLLWALGASETDPIRHRLSFERFYDDNRSDPPDVDIDFPKGVRDEVIQHAYEVYGKEHCSQIAALSQLGPASALADVAYAYGIPRSEFEALTSALDAKEDDVETQIEHIQDKKALAVLEKYPQLRVVQKVVGQYRQMSIHAAGILISAEPLDKAVGVVLSNDKKPVAAVDKYGAAELGFLKMDLLSVQALNVLETALQLAGLPHDYLYTLSMDDQKALEMANRGYLAGVFQLDGAAAARVAKQIGIDSFEDLVAASALCRPGPEAWVETYRRNKADMDEFIDYLETLHPVMRDIVQDTYGILLYQEQVMRIARELADFPWPDVHKLRKLITSSAGNVLDEMYHDKFVNACHEKGIYGADTLWDSIKTHGGYSFNKSHCVTYGLISYWMLHMKCHHSLAFYQAYLMHEEDPLLIKRLIYEFMSLGGSIELINPQISQARFTSDGNNNLIGGYESLWGVGTITSEKLQKVGPFVSWDAMAAALPKQTRTLLDKATANNEWDPCYGLKLAQWFPIPSMPKQDYDIRERYGLCRLRDFTAELQTEVTVMGYVVYTKADVKFDTERFRMLLEDDTGIALCRIARRQVAALITKFKELAEGDYICLTGWWSGDTIYVRDYVLIRRPGK